MGIDISYEVSLKCDNCGKEKAVYINEFKGFDEDLGWRIHQADGGWRIFRDFEGRKGYGKFFCLCPECKNLVKRKYVYNLKGKDSLIEYLEDYIRDGWIQTDIMRERRDDPGVYGVDIIKVPSMHGIKKFYKKYDKCKEIRDYEK